MKKYLLSLGLLLGGGALNSCESFLDENTDPNSPSAATPNLLLPNIIAQGFQTQMFTALRTPFITQYVVSRTANSGGNDQYYFTNAQSTNTFNYTYFYSGSNIPGMIQAAQAEGSPYYVGTGKIMMALLLSHATDMLGDIPYSEAFRGAQNYTPKYDAQEQIYATIFQLLREGAVQLKRPATDNSRPLYSTAPSISGDILYQGNTQKWVKLAYALRARQLQHLTKKSSYSAAAVLAACDSAFTSSADDAQLNFQTAVAPLTGTTNIFGTTRANFGTATFASNFVKYVNGNGTFPGVPDPRGPIMTSAATVGTAGIDPGRGGGVAVTSTGGVTDFYSSWYARDLGYFEVITYHELKFIEAEAAFKAGNIGRAFAAYREGIRAHMAKVGQGGSNASPAVTFPVITPTQIDNYLASAAAAQTPATLTIRNIMEQKYIAMFLNPESWSDLRRYDFSTQIYVNLVYPTYPANVPQASQPLKGQFPRRLLPGLTEVQYNPGEIARIGANDPDYVTRPLWWDMP
ncbi:SusD/RagB family nutrient-binding outer membrane lipoprotein [Hymenobacter algoricola]